MNRLRLFKYGATLATSGVVGTNFANSIIAAEVEGAEDGQSRYEKVFKNFKNSFTWSKIDDKIPISKDKNDPTLIRSLPAKDQYQAPKYPIVLCHGLSGFDRLVIVPSLNQMAGLLGAKQKTDGPEHGYVFEEKGGISLDYWYGIQEALEEKGTTVLVSKVPGFGSIEERAERLNHFITGAVDQVRKKSKEEVYNDDNETNKSTFKEEGEKLKVNLVAHSMGGLDCRWLISELEKKNYEVVSLTTITTPHRGSEVADYVVDLARNLPEQIKLPPSIYELTTDSLKTFNEKVKDDPNVLYFSYGATFIPKWYNAFYATWLIIHSKAGDNDGMVSVESAKWGTYLGTLSNLDHLDLINWTNSLKRIAKELTPGVSEDESGINTVNLYLDIADNLAKRGL